MPFQTPIITNAGMNAINQVLAGGHTLTITTTEFGSGFPSGTDVPANFTGLVSPKAPGKNTSANALTLYQTSIRTQISSADIATAFQINEIGVYAHLDSGTDFLFCYMTTGAATGDTLTPSMPANAVVKAYAIVIKYTQNVPVSTTITLDEVIQLHAPTHLADGVDPIPVATSADSGVAPKTNANVTQVLTGGATAAWAPVPVAASTNPGGGPSSPADPTQVLVASSPAAWAPVPIVTHLKPGGLPVTPLAPNYRPLTAADGSVSWQPTQPTLNVSTTLYIKAGNPDIAPNFTTLDNAMAYLSQYVFAPGISVLINVFPGTYAKPSPIYLNHVNGSQITIQGINAQGFLDTDVSYTGIGSISGSTGNWSVQLTGCSSTAAVQVGSYILAYYAAGIAGAGNTLVCGFFKVLVVTATTVTVQIPWQRPSWPAMTGFTAGTFTPINAIFTVTGQNQNGWSIGQNGLGAVRYLGLVYVAAQANNYVYGGMTASGPTGFNRVGVAGFAGNQPNNSGFNCWANCYLFNCAASGNATGLVAGGYANVNCYGCAFTHNGMRGVWTQTAALAAVHGATFVAGNSYLNGDAAVVVAVKGTLTSQGDVNGGNWIAGIWYCVLNAAKGMSISNQSVYNQTSANDQFYSQYNAQLGVAGTNYDVFIAVLSYVSQLSITGSKLYNIAVGVLSADGSYIG